MERDDSAKGYLFQFQQFSDTGTIIHHFGDGCEIQVGVEDSGDYTRGADIRVIIKDSDGTSICNVAIDKFGALCLAQSIMTSLMKQEELVYEAIRDNNRRFNQSGSELGQGA